MQCQFCQQEMKSIDNAPRENVPPQLTMIWTCNNCPHKVNLLCAKDAETEQHWIIRYMSIFVSYNDKRYCLKWDYRNKVFEIRDTAVDNLPHNYILRLDRLPGITPSNALEKLKTYLIFS